MGYFGKLFVNHINYLLTVSILVFCFLGVLVTSHRPLISSWELLFRLKV